jgi:hypothetical protein
MGEESSGPRLWRVSTKVPQNVQDTSQSWYDYMRVLLGYVRCYSADDYFSDNRIFVGIDCELSRRSMEGRDFPLTPLFFRHLDVIIVDTIP